MNELDQHWKSELRERCFKAISLLPEDEWDDDELEGELSEDAIEPPALYDFFEELLAMRNEVRKVNRKTADTFARFGDVLEGMQSDSTRLRELFSKESKDDEKKSGLSRDMAMALVGLLDRVQRLESTARTHNQKGWRGIMQSQEYVKKQGGAVSILADHLQKLLTSAKVELINARPGDIFDPLCMKAIGQLDGSDDNTQSTAPLVIVEECLPGYRLGEHCLRPAEVRLTRKNSTTTI